MPIDPELLEILVCPETHQPVKPADKNHQGEAISKPIEEGLVREDGKCLYLVDDGIPNMLIDERVDL